jgi:putative Ca2+/H+ antiporter (TMEM165/GDT1 family)
LAELGDKTQLAGLTFAARSKMPIVVFLGSLSAYAIVTLITVLMGGILGKFIKPEFVKYGAASLFIIIGILIFLGKI